MLLYFCFFTSMFAFFHVFVDFMGMVQSGGAPPADLARSAGRARTWPGRPVLPAGICIYSTL